MPEDACRPSAKHGYQHTAKRNPSRSRPSHISSGLGVPALVENHPNRLQIGAENRNRDFSRRRLPTAIEGCPSLSHRDSVGDLASPGVTKFEDEHRELTRNIPDSDCLCGVLIDKTGALFQQLFSIGYWLLFDSSFLSFVLTFGSFLKPSLLSPFLSSHVVSR
jgi:hypothetical protein